MTDPRWLLPTRGRPGLCQDALDACEAAKMTSPGIVYVDGRVDDYPNLRLPANWEKVVGDLDLQPIKNWFLERYPDASFYGLVLDDLLPRTEEFDRKMEHEAGDWYLIDTYDMWLANDPSTAAEGLCGAFGWGGELVRTVGWWGFPGVRQAGNDNAWCEILIHNMDPPMKRTLLDVTIEHRNWRTGKRPKDATDGWVRDGEAYIERDFKVFEKWRESGEPGRIATNIRSAME